MQQLTGKEAEYAINYIQKTSYTLQECVSTLSELLKKPQRMIWLTLSISAQNEILKKCKKN